MGENWEIREICFRNDQISQSSLFPNQTSICRGLSWLNQNTVDFMSSSWSGSTLNPGWSWCANFLWPPFMTYKCAVKGGLETDTWKWQATYFWNRKFWLCHENTWSLDFFHPFCFLFCFPFCFFFFALGWQSLYVSVTFTRLYLLHGWYCILNLILKI